MILLKPNGVLLPIIQMIQRDEGKEILVIGRSRIIVIAHVIVETL